MTAHASFDFINSNGGSGIYGLPVTGARQRPLDRGRPCSPVASLVSKLICCLCCLGATRESIRGPTSRCLLWAGPVGMKQTFVEWRRRSLVAPGVADPAGEAISENAENFNMLIRDAVAPRRVGMPPLESLYDDSVARGYDRQAWRYVHNTALELADCVVAMDERLKKICWCAWEIEVDGRLAAVDISDYHTLPSQSQNYPLWLRFCYTPMWEPFRNVGSFPITSFLDWGQYERMTSEGSPRSSPDDRSKIIFGQREYEGEILVDKTRRRRRVRDLLKQSFGDRLDDQWTNLEAYWMRASRGGAVVCVPGTNNHNLDRGQWQLMGLGVCTISPDIFSAPLGVRPEPGVHYVRCRDDYADLVEQVEWCLTHRAACDEIGTQAAEFFRNRGTPGAIWSYVKRRVETP